MATARRHLDQYFTPAHATRELLKRVQITGTVLECCSGDGAITGALDQTLIRGVVTNDIDPALSADYHFDASTDDPVWGSLWQHKFDWVVTNPPFNQTAQIVPLAYRYARVGIAMLLRLSFLEPCMDRDLWLRDHPPTKLIVLPRISFTGDGKTDNVTCAWFVWEKSVSASSVIVVPREGR